MTDPVDARDGRSIVALRDAVKRLRQCSPKTHKAKRFRRVSRHPSASGRRRAVMYQQRITRQATHGRYREDHAYHNSLAALTSQRVSAPIGVYHTYEQAYGPALSWRAGMLPDRPLEEEPR